MTINEDGTVEICGQTFTPRFKVRGPCDVRWLDHMPYPEIYGAGGVWLPLEELNYQEKQQ